MVHKRVSDRLGIRGQLFIWCAVVWIAFGMQVTFGPTVTIDGTLYHTAIPMWFRISSWIVPGVLCIYSAFSKKFVVTAVTMLIIAPMIRFTSYFWSVVTELIKDLQVGYPGPWFAAFTYGMMAILVVIIAHIKEPTSEEVVQ